MNDDEGKSWAPVDQESVWLQRLEELKNEVRDRRAKGMDYGELCRAASELLSGPQIKSTQPYAERWHVWAMSAGLRPEEWAQYD